MPPHSFRFHAMLGRTSAITYIYSCVIWLTYVTMAGKYQAFEAGTLNSAVLPVDHPSPGFALNAIYETVERMLRR